MLRMPVLTPLAPSFPTALQRQQDRHLRRSGVHVGVDTVQSFLTVAKRQVSRWRDSEEVVAKYDDVVTINFVLQTFTAMLANNYPHRSGSNVP